MRLRQKKTYSLSEDAFYLDFQNQQFQTLNRKTDTIKKPINTYSNPSSNIDINPKQYPQILAKFINNINFAKLSQKIKSKTSQPLKNATLQQAIKTKRLRKPSENTCFDEEKKVDYPRSGLAQMEFMPKKIRIQEKSEKYSKNFSITKPSTSTTTSSNKMKEFPEQNIINNLLIANSFNTENYARSNPFPPPPFVFNQQLINAYYHQMNPFFNKPNWQNLPFFPEDMKMGLNRQFQIYERFNPHPAEIEKKTLPLTVLNRIQEPKIQTKPEIIQPTKKMSPDKIFKRASYHVGIAYSIYMDNIQKEGKKINNFSDIDPTRFARKYKNAAQRF